MNTKAIRQLADVTLDKYRSSIPRKAFEEFVKDIIAGENRATAFRYEATPICRASFPSTLDEDGARCTVEVTVYRLNAVAVTAFLLDGPETLLRHIGLDERDTYETPHRNEAGRDPAPPQRPRPRARERHPCHLRRDAHLQRHRKKGAQQ